MTKIAIVDKYNRGTDYISIFEGINADEYHLCTKNIKKLLKKDIDIEIDPDNYDFIITVGADATKFFSPSSTVSSHQGYLVDEKYLPIIDPTMLVFKPGMEGAFNKAVDNILNYVNGNTKPAIHRESIGVQDEDLAEATLLEILKADKTVCALDTETSALYPRDGYVLGISIAISTTKGYYISSEVMNDTCVSLMQKIINKHHIVFHNAKFDIAMLAYHFGLDFGLKQILNPDSFDDTMVMHYCLDETQGTHGLKDLAIKYTDLGDYDRDLELFKKEYRSLHKIKISDFTYDLIPFDIMYPYAAIDTMATLELYYKFIDLLKNSKLEGAYNMIKRGIKLLVKIEDNGVPFSTDKLHKAQVELTEQIYALESSLYDYKEVFTLEKQLEVKFNPNSTQQLAFLFYHVLNLPKHGKKTATGADSMDVEVLTALSTKHPIVSIISELKKLKKIKSTYIDKILIGLDWDNKLRTGFNLTTTTSGRLSSSGKLNMQQLPRDNKIVKACISAGGDYVIVSQDLGTAEMYVAAVLSGDKNLQKVFINKQNGTGADFHSTIAHMVFRIPCDVKDVKKLHPLLRQAAKAISFGILYGSGPDKVADTVNSEGGNYTVEDAKEAINTYFATFPKLKKWLDNNKQYIKTNGFIYSIFGRKRRLGNVFSKDRATQGHEIRSGINFLVQSVASDINLLATIEIQNYIYNTEIDVELFGLVHDSILAKVHVKDLDEYLRIAKDFTQKDFGVMIPNCPISVDQEVGKDYSFKEELEEAA